jgi:GT2 family glycosyltransferase
MTQVSLPRIAVLMTCFNRRDSSLKALERLFAQKREHYSHLSIFLVDDGSTDGTADAIRSAFPNVRVLAGDGSLFWNGGMRKAFAAAMHEGFDYYLWLNDDSHLYPDAIERILSTARDYQALELPAIFTGTMVSSMTGERTYGGQTMRTQGLRVTFDEVQPDSQVPLECSTMNGNFVLVPDIVARLLDNLEPTFRHQIGDLDYGLRAREAGIRVVIAPGFHGVCDDNSRKSTWRDSTAPLRQRWRHLMSPKGAPPREWLLYVRRHFGWRWPLYFASPYIKTAFNLGKNKGQHRLS